MAGQISPTRSALLASKASLKTATGGADLLKRKRDALIGEFFALVKDALAADPSIKLLFLCSPGNPTGTLIPLSVIRELVEFEAFRGIVVVDEAYIDFAGADASAARLVTEYANLCVMQTLSKSEGCLRFRECSFDLCVDGTPSTCSSRCSTSQNRRTTRVSWDAEPHTTGY